MGIYILVGFMFVILMAVCCFRCTADDWQVGKKYEQMIDEYKEKEGRNSIF